jgi:hypothetical protein
MYQDKKDDFNSFIVFFHKFLPFCKNSQDVCISIVSGSLLLLASLSSLLLLACLLLIVCLLLQAILLLLASL